MFPNAVQESRLEQRLQGPSWEHWLGVDQLGRDLGMRLLQGAKYTIGSAMVVVVCTMCVGIPLGMWSAFQQGRVDRLLMSLSNTLLIMPSFILALILSSLTPYPQLALFLPLFTFYTMSFYRMVRALTMRMCGVGHVVYAHLSGHSKRWIMVAHIWPFLRREIFVIGCAEMGTIMLVISALSYLGIGWDAETAEWGTMLQEAQRVIATHPWEMVVPAGAIMGVCYTCFWVSARWHAGSNELSK
jgi:ABC-type dipeptide/oligopeptide/nickel transport system permease subunit